MKDNGQYYFKILLLCDKYITYKNIKPEELKHCGIFSRDCMEAMKAIGPNPHDFCLFSCSVCNRQ